MTNEEILKLAERCGFYLVDFIDGDEVTEQIESATSESLYIFAAMLLAMESDECAKLCEAAALLPDAGPIYCANAIRARNA
jgi:hypothetical protein